MKRIVADPRKCLGCRGCELACAEAHARSEGLLAAIAEGSRPRIYVETASGLAVPLQCRHCEDAPCIRVCPTAALARLHGAAPVLVEQAKCIGCGFCVEACPFGVIRLARCAGSDSDNGCVAVIKCDLCPNRTAAGLQPACVAACPVRALGFEEVDDGARRRARATAAATVDDGDGAR